jgi:hypothetical protein
MIQDVNTSETVLWPTELVSSITENSVVIEALRTEFSVSVNIDGSNIVIRGPTAQRQAAKASLQKTKQRLELEKAAAEKLVVAPAPSRPAPHRRSKSTTSTVLSMVTLGIPIPTQYHAQLIGRGGARCREIQLEAGAIVSFPGSQNYRSIASPTNEEVDNAHPSTVVKVTGMRASCEKAIEILKVCAWTVFFSTWDVLT